MATCSFFHDYFVWVYGFTCSLADCNVWWNDVSYHFSVWGHSVPCSPRSHSPIYASVCQHWRYLFKQRADGNSHQNDAILSLAIQTETLPHASPPEAHSHRNAWLHIETSRAQTRDLPVMYPPLAPSPPLHHSDALPDRLVERMPPTREWLHLWHCSAKLWNLWETKGLIWFLFLRSHCYFEPIPNFFGFFCTLYSQLFGFHFGFLFGFVWVSSGERKCNTDTWDRNS